jgi:hypothetical protein
MFLNDGNCFINRKKYLDLVENLPNNKEKTYAADCIAFQYYWMISGNYSKVIKEFKYFHLLRDDSYWMSCGSNSSIMFEYYVNLFKGV